MAGNFKMFDLNAVELSGYVGREPELKYTSSGMAYCKLSVAHTKRWKDKATGAKQEKTTWVSVMAWNKLAEWIGDCGEFKKGTPVLVFGELDEWEYTPQGSSESKKGLQIRARRVVQLTWNGSTGESSGQHHSAQEPDRPRSTVSTGRQRPTVTEDDDIPEDDIPF